MNQSFNKVKLAVFAVATVGVSFLAWIALTANHSPAQAPQQPAARRQVSVRLLGSANEIIGVAVPPGLADKSDTYLRVLEPADVAISLADGRVIRVTVEKYLSINVDHGVVVDINLLPQRAAVEMRDAVADLRRLMREIKIEPDQKMESKIASWPAESRDFTYRAEVKLSDSVTFLVKIRPNDDGRNFLVLTFAADGQARRDVADGKFTPSPQGNRSGASDGNM